MPKQKPRREVGSKIEITEVKRVSEPEVMGALKEIARIPQSHLERLLWEDNGMPSKRSEAETRAAYEEARSWASSSLYELQKHIKTDQEITLLSASGAAKSKLSDYLLSNLVEARAHENIEYLFSASIMYLHSVDLILAQRQNINSGALRWARELTEHSDVIYRKHIAKGGHDNEFAPVWEDLRYTKERLNSLEKLKPRDLSEINFVIDDMLSNHSEGLDPKALRTIDNRVFAALLTQKTVAANELNYAAFELASACSEALEMGSRELAQNLYAMAKATFTRYKRWQMAEGIMPNTGSRISINTDSRMHDHLLVHKVLAKLEKQLSES